MKKNIQSSLVIGIMCFLLTFGIVVQISSIEKESTVVAQANTENELRDEVLKLTDEYNRLYKKLEKREKKLEELREKVSSNSEQSKKMSESLNKINNCLGLTKLTGKGIKIELQTGDLLQILNALNNAGVDAISINGKRIIFKTEIKDDEEIISIDGTELKKPYQIEAIGGDNLYNAITMPGSYIDNLKSAEYEVTVTQQDSITIEKYTGVYNFNFAKNIMQ